jgi:type I restriction enzyme S subunit
MSKNMNVPKLRFSEFSGEWEEKKLGDIGKVTMCKRIMKDQTLLLGDIPFYKIGTFGKEADAYIPQELYENFKEKYPYPQKGDILIAASGATYGKTVVFDGSDSYFQDSNIVWIANNEKLVTNNFLNFIYRRVKWTIEESTIPRLYNGTISSTFLNVPTLKEQEKIASFLTSVDTKIEQLTKKEALLQEYKKGVMNKIFNQEIRFKDDDGREFPEWENSSLGNVLDYVQPTKYLVKDTEYNNSYNTPVLTAGKTFVLGYTNETDGIFGNNLPVIIFDDFTTANKFVDFPFKAKSSAMKILIPKNSNNIKFIYETMQMIKYEVGGHERHWISKFTFLNIFMPCIQEQTKIANFLSSIDKKIELTTKELNSTKEFKKALLQQMFV